MPDERSHSREVAKEGQLGCFDLFCEGHPTCRRDALQSVIGGFQLGINTLKGSDSQVAPTGELA